MSKPSYDPEKEHLRRSLELHEFLINQVADTLEHAKTDLGIKMNEARRSGTDHNLVKLSVRINAMSAMIQAGLKNIPPSYTHADLEEMAEIDELERIQRRESSLGGEFRDDFKF